jgi:hypothetical protein
MLGVIVECAREDRSPHGEAGESYRTTGRFKGGVAVNSATRDPLMQRFRIASISVMLAS